MRTKKLKQTDLVFPNKGHFSAGRPFLGFPGSGCVGKDEHFFHYDFLHMLIQSYCYAPGKSGGFTEVNNFHLLSQEVLWKKNLINANVKTLSWSRTLQMKK